MDPGAGAGTAASLHGLPPALFAPLAAQPPAQRQFNVGDTGLPDDQGQLVLTPTQLVAGRASLPLTGQRGVGHEGSPGIGAPHVTPDRFYPSSGDDS